MWSLSLAVLAAPVFAATVPDEHPTIQQAVDHAASGAVIFVAPGDYRESLVIDKDVLIVGENPTQPTRLLPAGSDRIIQVAAGRQVVLRDLVLDGEGTSGGLYAESAAALIFERSTCRNTTAPNGGCILADQPDTVLYVLQSRFEQNTALGGRGGHIAALKTGQLTVDQSRFTEGHAYEGGAIYAEGDASQQGEIFLWDSSFERNEADRLGGAVALRHMRLFGQNSWFLQNDALYSGGLGTDDGLTELFGGGFVENRALTRGGSAQAFAGALGATGGSAIRLRRVAMVGNLSDSFAGALYANGLGEVEIIDSWVSENMARDAGGLDFPQGSYSIEGTMFRANEATGTGGAVISTGASESTIVGSFFCENVANLGDGGALYIGSGVDLEMVASVFFRNTAIQGGAVTNYGHLEVGHNAFVENYATIFGEASALATFSGPLSSIRTHFVRNQGGPAVISYSSGAPLSLYDNWFQNPEGDWQYLAPLYPSFFDPHFYDYTYGTTGCADVDLRQNFSAQVGPWSSPNQVPTPRWYEDLDGDGEIGLTDCDDSDPLRHSNSAWYPDADGDGVGDSGGVVQYGCFPPGMDWVLTGGDCDDTDPRYIEERVMYADVDGDGYGDPATAVLVCGPIPVGWVTDGTDCDDSDPAVNPDSLWFMDADGDGYGDAHASTGPTCTAPPNHVLDSSDCDDSNPLIHPGTIWYPDVDGDGYGDPLGALSPRCERPPGYVLDNTDCDDTLADVNPGATEICDGRDNNCDGTTDVGAVDAAIWAPDEDQDGYGDDSNAALLCAPPADWVQMLGDCDDQNDQVYPGAPEICDGEDNNCNGIIDEDAVDQVLWALDADGDGWGGEEGQQVLGCEPPDGYGPPGDCDDSDPAVHPDAPEVCNGVDDNCSGLIDDEDPGLDPATTPIWYPDADGDGLGDPDGATLACEAPEGHVPNGEDCNDDDAEVGRCSEIPGHPDHVPPESGKSGVAAPGSPDRHGVGCQHGGGGPLGPLAWLGVAVLMGLRRRALR